MADNLEIIHHIIEFHHSLRGQIDNINGSISDVEALFGLRSEYASWTQTSLNQLSERQKKLQQTIDVLESGLQKHFAYEEENLPPIFGAIMMRGLLIEHTSIREEVENVKKMVLNTRLEGLERDEIVLHKSKFQGSINNLAQHIEKHASREEIVLDMARLGLEN